MPHYIVEHEYKTPLTEEAHNEESARAKPCLEQYGVKWHGSWLAVDRMKMFCDFEAPSSEQIRDALRSADVAFARVWQTHRWVP